MHKHQLNSKTIVALVVSLAFFAAVSIAGEERSDAGGQWKYMLEYSDAATAENMTGHMRT